jgi:hypothetical protein
LQCLEEMVGLAALEVVPVDLEALVEDTVALAAADLVVLAEALGEPVAQSVVLVDRQNMEALALVSPIRRCIIVDRCLMGCSSTSPSWPKCIVLGTFCVSWIWVDLFRPRSWISSLPCLAVR